MKRLTLILSAIFAIYGTSFACTSAIVTAQRSSEGAPLLWKHRDSKFSNTRVDYITGGKYAYTGIVANNENYKRGMYAGINEVGVGSISTNTKNLPVSSQEEWDACTLPRLKSSIHRLSLQNCATVDEFEELVRSTKRRRGYMTNLGIADATGVVSYFEIWDIGYRRYDVTNNEGFDVRTNYSHAGDPEKKGLSTRRYDITMQHMNAHNGTFSPQDLINYSRSYNSCKFGNVLDTDKTYTCSSHTVPRYSSVASIVLVCDGNNPRMLVMNGHPVSSLAVPVYVKAKQEIPMCVKGDKMRLLSEDFRSLAYTKKGKYHRLNKQVVRDVLKIKQPEIVMPKEMPANIKAFNKSIDKKYSKYEKQVRRALAKHN
ncbi:MAG: hypothetical protein IKY57_03455 [Alistipes sp.]|nr:hypothetical protein [Alistipes sp.]